MASTGPATASPPPVVPGFTVHGRLGRGASGSVWDAVRDSDGMAVAVKVIPMSVGDTDRAERLAFELGVSRRLTAELAREHHVVAVSATMVLPGPPPAVALVLDLMEGGSLADVVTNRTHLSAGEIVTIMTPVARALELLHSLGLVHGDVSPGNVLFDLSGRPSLSDLGVSRLLGDTATDVWGTEGFTAPELWVGDPPTTASDVYAVGALAWFAATGRPPGPPGLRDDASGLMAALPRPLVRAIEACLAPDPTARPSADVVALTIFDAAPAEPLRLVHGDDELALLTRRIRATAGQESSAPEPVGRRRRRADALRRRWAARRSWARGAAVIGLAALAVVAVVVDWRPDDPQTAAAAPVVTPAAPAARSTRSVAPTPWPAGPGPTTTRAPATTDRDAPRTRPVDLVGELSNALAEAWMAADPGLLAAVDAPGSPAMEHDRARIDRIRDAGHRYRSVTLTPRLVTTRSVSATRAEIVATVDTSAHRVESGAEADNRPATEGTPLLFGLQWTSDGWRVHDIGPA